MKPDIENKLLEENKALGMLLMVGGVALGFLFALVFYFVWTGADTGGYAAEPVLVLSGLAVLASLNVFWVGTILIRKK